MGALLQCSGQGQGHMLEARTPSATLRMLRYIIWDSPNAQWDTAGLHTFTRTRETLSRRAYGPACSTHTLSCAQTGALENEEGVACGRMDDVAAMSTQR